MLRVIRTQSFKRQKCFTEQEEQDLFVYLATNPTAGDVIPGTGGVRKLRFAAGGKGKRGGARVIYYYHDATCPIFLFAAYAKSKKEDLTPEQNKTFSKIVNTIKETIRNGQRDF
jgi:hypothetical protein